MTQENQQGEPAATGGYGTPTPEQELGQGQDQASGGAGGVDTNEPQAGGGEPLTHGADLPSSAAEIDETNDDSRGSAPVSSESGQEAAGLPDGSGNDLPREKQANDDGGESFDAG